MEHLTSERESCDESIAGNSSLERYSIRSHSSASITASKSISFCEKNFVPFFPSFYTINETDRLLSDQGLITSKPRTSALCRQVRDKSYYKGLIYLKGKEIREEIKRLENEINLLSIQHSMYVPYKRKAELKAMELEKLQDTLANYNLVDDMLNREIQMKEASEEVESLKAENTRENAEGEKLFELKKQREEVIKELETDLEQEKYVSEILTTTINPELRGKYIKLKRLDDKFQAAWLKQEKEIRELSNKQRALESQCNENLYSEALHLLRKLKDLDNQKDALFQENTFSSISEEKDYLQKHYVESSELVKVMLQEIRILENKIKEKLYELDGMEDENSPRHSERSEKYSKLRKREKVIDDFLSSYSDQQLVLLTEQKQYEFEISQLLRNISSILNYFNLTLPCTESITYENFTDENTESVVPLRSQFFKLVSEVNEINNLESKLNEELKSVKDEISTKEKELSMYSGTEILTKDMKIKETDIIQEMKQIKRRKQAYKCVIDTLQKYHSSLEKKLNGNETYLMLSELEKRWHLLEADNYNMENFIVSDKYTANYLPVKENVKSIYSELNNLLKNDSKFQCIF